MRRPAVALAAALLALMPGCASVPNDPAARAAFRANNDPLEPMNRDVFAFNEVIDRSIIKPVAQGYVNVVPRAGRDAIYNVLKNLKEPIVFGNDMLQGEGRRAATTAGRFLLNTTVGVLGIWDFAGKHGLARQTGDFGQTLHVWGVGEGPYLIVPIWGPTSPRDGIGLGVDVYLDPLRYVAARYNYPSGISAAEQVTAGIDERSRNLESLDELKRESIDYYAAFRSLYRQHRKAEVERDTAPPPATDDMYSDPDSPAAPGGAAAKQGSS
jgi:phospholipid-binding lipoprotein MlaA